MNMDKTRTVEGLYETLAAVLNALDAAGEQVKPLVTRGYWAVGGESGTVEANKAEGRWTVDFRGFEEDDEN